MTVSDAELPNPWNVLMIRTVVKPPMKAPQMVERKSSRVDRTRTARRPKMFDSGTQTTFPRPSDRTLNWVPRQRAEVEGGQSNCGIPQPAPSEH